MFPTAVTLTEAVWQRGESSTRLGQTGKQQNLPIRTTSEQFEDVYVRNHSSSTGSALGLEARQASFLNEICNL